MDNKVIIFDTTLRDGEQAPGFSMNIEDKLKMARQLERLNVDILEAGFPIASEGDFEAVRAVGGVEAMKAKLGGEGSAFVLAKYPELFAGAELVLNEGGSNRVVAGDVRWWGVEVAQKRPLWLEVSTSGRGGHGGLPTRVRRPGIVADADHSRGGEQPGRCALDRLRTAGRPCRAGLALFPGG